MTTDLEYALRQLRNNRGFAAIAILTLGIGIGANTAMFSLVDAVILRPLSYRDTERLEAIHENTPQFGLMPVNALHFEQWRTTGAFEEMALLDGYSSNLTGGAEPERVDVGRASASLFPMLGVRAQLGRTFVGGEDQAGRNHVAVIDDRLWRRRFAGVASVLPYRPAVCLINATAIGPLP